MEITKEDIIRYKKYIKGGYKDGALYICLSSKFKKYVNKMANKFFKELEKYSDSYSIRNAYLLLYNYIIILHYQEKYKKLNKIIYGIGDCVDAIDDISKQLKQHSKIVKDYYELLEE